jgi:folylpolyglutamate synthase/dihydropteroate synthase
MPSCDNSTPHMGVLTDTHINQVIIIMLIVDLQVLVTGSLHLVGDVLKLLKR